MSSPTAPAPRTLDELAGPPSLPLLGSLHLLSLTKVHEVLEDWSRAYGPVFAFRIGSRRGVGIRDPDVVRALMQDRPDGLRRFGTMESVASELGMRGVFAAEGADWRRQRRLINPSFHPHRLEAFEPALREVVGRFVTHLEEPSRAGQPVDVLRALMRFTVDVTSLVSFGRDLDTVRRGGAEVQDHLERLFPAIGRRVMAPFPYWKVFPFLERRVDRAHEAVRGLLLSLIADARAKLASREGEPATLLESMVAATDEDAKEPLTDDEVYANVVTLLLAGEDTTAITIAWMLYYLALHPEVAVRAREEVDANVAGVVPTLEEAKRLRYVEGIALEALRLRPPGPQLMLEAKRDQRIGDVEVPAGTGVILMLRLIQLDPSLFGDPTSFRPERHLPDAPTDTRPHTPRMFLAFGAGPRVCPGRGLALLESTLLVAALLRRYDVAFACRPEDVHEVTTFTTHPVGLRMRFAQRRAAIG